MTRHQAKILIVDDDKFIIDVLVDLLKGDYRLLIAKSGEQALKRVNSPDSVPDLILLDVMMPDMDGYEVCRRIKSGFKTRDIPVIFITALNNVDEERRGFQSGAVDYITKPVSPPIVQARVSTHLELKRSRDLLEVLAKEDGLTGIANRRRFDEFFDFEWNRAKRSKSLISLLLLDIDFFKSYNDNYGHSMGDKCLKKVATALSDAMPRSQDLIARYGGEEFASVLPDTDGAGAMTVARRLLERVRNLEIKHEYSKSAAFITMSAGVATTVPYKEDNSLFFIETADKALYNAKEGGRNRVEFEEFGNKQ